MTISVNADNSDQVRWNSLTEDQLPMPSKVPQNRCFFRKRRKTLQYFNGNGFVIELVDILE